MDATTDVREVSSTADVLDNHLAAFFKRDLEGVLADYAPNAVMLTQSGTLVGIEGIGPMFRALFEEFGRGMVSFDMQTRYTVGDHGFIVWKAETLDNVYEFATDTFVIRNGEIVAQSFVAKTLSKQVSAPV
jgi:hypothetical protein